MSEITGKNIIPDAPSWYVRGDTQNANYVVTLCSRKQIDQALISARQLIQQHGDAISETKSTATEKYAQLHFKTNSEQAWQLFQKLLTELDGTDIAAQPADWQPKKLLICDMDKTIVDAETLDEVAELVGIGKQVAQITEQAMRGEIDFHGALRERIKLLTGQPEKVFQDVVEATPINPGAAELIAQANASGMTTILISGGFEQVARPIAERLGFDAVCLAPGLPHGAAPVGRGVSPLAVDAVAVGGVALRIFVAGGPAGWAGLLGGAVSGDVPQAVAPEAPLDSGHIGGQGPFPLLDG